MKNLLVHASLKHQLLAKTLTPFTGTSGLYSSVIPDADSRDQIFSLCAKLGIEITEEEELHCTIMYSPEDAPPKDAVIRNASSATCTAVPIGFEIFGPNEDTLVMTLASNSLARLHYKWRALGCKSTYPDYRSHITLAKPTSVTQEQLESFTASVLNDLPIVLTFQPEQIEDIS